MYRSISPIVPTLSLFPYPSLPFCQFLVPSLAPSSLPIPLPPLGDRSESAEFAQPLRVSRACSTLLDTELGSLHHCPPGPAAPWPRLVVFQVWLPAAASRSGSLSCDARRRLPEPAAVAAPGRPNLSIGEAAGRLRSGLTGVVYTACTPPTEGALRPRRGQQAIAGLHGPAPPGVFQPLPTETETETAGRGGGRDERESRGYIYIYIDR